MKNVLKYIGFCFLGVVILLYLAFLIVPPFVNLDNYKSEIQKLVKENSKLNIDYSSLKLYSTPLLSIGVDVKDINIFYDDDSSLLKISKLKGGIALPSLLTLSAKTSRIYIDNPNINLEIVDSSQYKIIALVEKIINEQNKKSAQKQDVEMNKYLKSILKKVRIKVPFVKIANYCVNINDLETSHNLKLNGEELILKYASARNKLKIKTIANLYSDNNKNINLDINTSLPTPKISLVSDKPKEKTDPDEEISIPFVNIVDIYQTYNLKTDIKARLNILKSKDNHYKGFGYLNVDNLTLKLSHTELPESFLHAKFHSEKIYYDTNIYTHKDEKISLLGYLKYGKRKELKADIQSDKISFIHLVDLLKGLLDSLGIKNDIQSIKTTGYISANAQIKTNFKHLKSNGNIAINNGSFIHSKTGLGIKDIESKLNFENNTLNIQNTKAIINNSPVKMNGFVDSKSNTSITLSAQNLALPVLYQTFAPKEIKKAYNLSGANLSLDGYINGKLDNLNSKINAKLNNLALSDAKKTMFITNSRAIFNLEANKEFIKANFENSGFIFNIPSVNLKTAIQKINVDIDKTNITINPFDVIYNTHSKITTKGTIKNYLSKPDIDIFLDGFISTLNINQTLGKDLAHFIPSKGNIPLKVSIKGNTKEQNIIAQIYADNNNFISPINIDSIYALPSIIQLSAKIKGNKIKTNNTGLYKKANSIFSTDLKSNMNSSKQLVELSAVIDKNHLNLLRLNIPHELKGKIAIFKNSTFKTKGKLITQGDFDDLDYRGNLKIYDVNIPEILTGVKNIDLNLSSKTLKLIAKEINLNNSKINSALSASLIPSKTFKISNLEINSNLIDVDKTLLILNELNKYLPKTSSKKQLSSAQSANIPLEAEGKFNIKKITTGQMEILNSKGNISIKNNNLLINKLSARGFKGAIKGDIGVNLINQLISVKLNGSKINADELFHKAANMKDTISGTLAFKTDISLKGATLDEQMKSLKGDVDFEIKDGQYGPFAKLENFFLAQNVRENAFFKNTIGVVLNPITTIDSTHFENLRGKITFKNGVAYLNSITSQGDILCILINGDMNLLSNNLNSNVRVRLASAVSDMLGPLAMANPVNLVKNTPGLNIASAKLFSYFTEVVPESDYKKIPDFSSKHTDANATKFQIILKGDVAKPLSLVKSFKWLALEKDMELAREFSEKYIKEQEDLARQALVKKLQEEYEENNKIKVGISKVLQMDTTAPSVKELIMGDVLNLVKEKTGIIQTSTTNIQNEENENNSKNTPEENNQTQEGVNNGIN